MSASGRRDPPSGRGTSAAEGAWSGWGAWELAAAGLLVAGVLLPVDPLAGALTVEGGADPERIRTGVWLLKAALALNGVALWLLRPILSAGAGRRDAAGVRPTPGPPVVAVAGSAGGSRAREAALALGGILLVGTVLRLVALGEGLWFDEILTLVDSVDVPLPRVLGTYASQNDHPLYSILAKGATELLGMEAWALRLPAAVLGVASLWAVYWFGAKVTARREALLAAAFLALSYHHVWFSQNARAYTALLLGTLVGTGLFLRIATGEGDRRGLPVVAYAGTMALTMFAHATAVVVLVAHAAVLGWAVLRDPAIRRGDGARRLAGGLLLAGTVTFLLYAPILPQVLAAVVPDGAEAAAESTVAWQSPLWMVAETLRGLARGVPGGLAAVAAVGAVVALGAGSYLRRGPRLVALMLLPGLILGALLLATRHNLWPRFFFFSAGFGVLILIRGLFVAGAGIRVAASRVLPSRRLARVPEGAPGVALAAACVLASALTLPSAWGPKQDYAAAAAWVDARAEPGDEVVTVAMTVLPYRDYLGRDWRAVETEADLRRVEEGADTTWLLYTFPIRVRDVNPDVWARIQREYRSATVVRGTLAGGDIVVVRRGAYPSAPSQPASTPNRTGGR